MVGILIINLHKVAYDDEVCVGVCGGGVNNMKNKKNTVQKSYQNRCKTNKGLEKYQ